ncbi:MAG: hypothetical protein AABX10_01900 [Nanoarchaeota archaeon]
MTEILPRKIEEKTNNLAELVVVNRFYDAGCGDTGGSGLVASRYNTDPLYEVRFRSSTSRGSLLSPRPGRIRKDLRDPYKEIEFEGTLADLTIEDLREKLPVEERGICRAVQIVSIGANCYGNNTLRMNLFK